MSTSRGGGATSGPTEESDEAVPTVASGGPGGAGPVGAVRAGRGRGAGGAGTGERGRDDGTVRRRGPGRSAAGSWSAGAGRRAGPAVDPGAAVGRRAGRSGSLRGFRTRIGDRRSVAGPRRRGPNLRRDGVLPSSRGRGDATRGACCQPIEGSHEPISTPADAIDAAIERLGVTGPAPGRARPVCRCFGRGRMSPDGRRCVSPSPCWRPVGHLAGEPGAERWVARRKPVNQDPPWPPLGKRTGALRIRPPLRRGGRRSRRRGLRRAQPTDKRRRPGAGTGRRDRLFDVDQTC